MNLVILLLLLANIAGIYYGYYEQSPRISPYPQPNQQTLPENVLLLPLYQQLNFSKNIITTGVDKKVIELPIDTEGWGNNSKAYRLKIAESNAWDDLENKSIPLTNSEINHLINPVANDNTLAKTTEIIETASINLDPINKPIKKTDLETETRLNFINKLVEMTTIETTKIVLIDMSINDLSLIQIPDSPAVELDSPPIFTTIATNTDQIEKSDKDNKPTISYAKTEIIDITSEPQVELDKTQIILSAGIANALTQGLEARISHAPIINTPSKLNLNPIPTQTQLLKETPNIKLSYTAEPDASNLVMALTGHSHLTHLQTPIKPLVTKSSVLPTTKSIQTTNKTLTWQCYRTGSFTQKKAAKTALNWWQVKTQQLELIQDKLTVNSQITLYLPAFNNSAEVKLAMAHLKQVNIAHYLMDKPKYAIAVGTFNHQKNAQKQREQLKKYGYHRIEQILKKSNTSRYYLRLKLNQNQQKWLDDFSQSQGVLIPTKTKYCPK